MCASTGLCCAFLFLPFVKFQCHSDKKALNALNVFLLAVTVSLCTSVAVVQMDAAEVTIVERTADIIENSSSHCCT